MMKDEMELSGDGLTFIFISKVGHIGTKSFQEFYFFYLINRILFFHLNFENACLSNLHGRNTIADLILGIILAGAML